jgi:hypothetical protein
VKISEIVFPESKTLAWYTKSENYADKSFLSIDTAGLVAQLKKKHFIVGPLSTDGEWKKNKENPNWPEPLRDTWNQLCITSNELAEEFNQNLHKIAFIRKEKSPSKA